MKIYIVKSDTRGWLAKIPYIQVFDNEEEARIIFDKTASELINDGPFDQVRNIRRSEESICVDDGFEASFSVTFSSVDVGTREVSEEKVYTLCISNSDVSASTSVSVFRTRTAAVESMKRSFVEAAKKFYDGEVLLDKEKLSNNFELGYKNSERDLFSFGEFHEKEGYAWIGDENFTVTFEIVEQKVQDQPITECPFFDNYGGENE